MLMSSLLSFPLTVFWPLRDVWLHPSEGLRSPTAQSQGKTQRSHWSLRPQAGAAASGQMAVTVFFSPKGTQSLRPCQVLRVGVTIIGARKRRPAGAKVLLASDTAKKH